MFEKEAEDSWQSKDLWYKVNADESSYKTGFKDGYSTKEMAELKDKRMAELEKENAELKSKVEELEKRGKQNYEHYMMTHEELSGKIKDWEDTCKSYCEDLDTAKKLLKP